MGKPLKLSPAVALVRCSTLRQEGSTKDQINQVRAWCEREGRSLARVFEDEGVSGALLDRPGLRALLAYVEDASNPKGVVVVWKRNRLVRPEDPRDGLALERRIERTGWILHYLQGRVATGDVLCDSILGVVEHHESGQYLRNLAADCLRGSISAFESGKRCGMQVPYGLAKQITAADGSVRVVPRGVSHSVAKGESSRWVPGDEREVATVRRIFVGYASGNESLTGLARALNAEGVPSPKGARWRRGVIRNLLTNEVYTGEVVWGLQASGKYYQRGAHGPVPVKGEDRASVDPIRHTDAHEALVPRALFDQANAVLLSRAGSARGVKQGSKRAWPLSGTLHCGVCGSSMTGTINGRKAYRRRDYVCSGGKAKGVCKLYQLRADDLHRAVLAKIKAAVLPRSRKVLEMVLDRLAAAGREDGPNTDALSRETRALEGKITRAVTNMGEVSPAVAKRIGQQIEAWESRLAELEHKQAMAEAQRAALPNVETLTATARELLEELEETGEKAPRPVLRRLLSATVERLEVRFGPERVKVPGKQGRGRYPYLGGLLTLTPLAARLADYPLSVLSSPRLGRG